MSVDDIMIPRGEIAYVDVSDDWDTILDALRSTPHTRLPVCQGNLDNIVGILHMKKVARALARGDFRSRALAAAGAEARSVLSCPRARHSTCSSSISSATGAASRSSSTSTATSRDW
jgi:CBS domain containing-hemolysin-like protein